MYLLYEVYDPAHEKAEKRAKESVNVLSSLELLRGSTKVYETPMVQATAINVENRNAVAVELDVPLAGLKPGQYVCQLNVIDDAAGLCVSAVCGAGRGCRECRRGAECGRGR